jgi:hypothetical protein
MADNTAFHGFRYIGPAGGGTPPAIVPCRVASAYGYAFYPGDVVKRIAAGLVDHSGTGEAVYGVVMGIGRYYDGTKMRYNTTLPASTTYSTNYERESTLLVMPALGQLFEACLDAAWTTATYAGIRSLVGTNIDHVATASQGGNFYLDPDACVAATAQWRVIDCPRELGLDYTGAYVPLIVMANETQGPGPASAFTGVSSS